MIAEEIDIAYCAACERKPSINTGLCTYGCQWDGWPAYRATHEELRRGWTPPATQTRPLTIVRYRRIHDVSK